MLKFNVSNRAKLRLVAAPVVGVVLLAGLVVGAKKCKTSGLEHGSHTSSLKLSDTLGKKNLAPLVIIGSGPAGLTAAIYGRRGGLKTIVIEGNEPGGLLTKTTHVENWPGERSILGPELIKQMHEQAKDLGVEFVTDMVESIDTSSWPYRVVTEDDKVFDAMSIIVATGAKPRKLDIPGEETYWGRGVTSCAICDAPFFKDKEVVVIGGGDSAVEEAFQLVPYVNAVTILVRKDTMRAAASVQERLKGNPKIAVRYNVEPREIVGDGAKVTGIVLYDVKDKTQTTMPTDGVFLAIGHLPNSGIVKDLVSVDAAGYVEMKDRTQESSVEGIFAAGEVEDQRYKQAIVSAGHGASAALDALNFLRELGYMPGVEEKDAQALPLKPDEPDYSSELPIIGSQQELDQLLAASKTPVVVDFYTEECVACKHMMPAVQALAHELQSAVHMVKVDAQQAEDIVRMYDIRKVPTFMMIEAGKLPLTSDKISSKKELVTFIEEYLQK